LPKHESYGPTNHKVVDTHNPQPVTDTPSESYTDPLTQARLRRQVIGTCQTGALIVGSIALSSGMPLYWRHRHGTRPGPGEFNRSVAGIYQQVLAAADPPARHREISPNQRRRHVAAVPDAARQRQLWRLDCAYRGGRTVPAAAIGQTPA